MDIKVNAAEWSELGEPDRQKIEGIISGFFKEARIVPDAATPASGIQPQALWGGKPFCKAACTVAESAAVAACASLGNPVAIAACVTAAHLAGEECRNRC